MRRFARVFVVLLALLWSVPAALAAGPEPIGPGTTLQLIAEEINGAPQHVGVVVVDPTESLVAIKVGRAPRVGERERVSTQAARETRSQHAVIAAVNGDFFDNSAGFAGIPTGIFVVNGELLVNPWGPALGFAEDGRPFIGTPEWLAKVEILDESGRVVAQRQLDAVNRRRDENRLVLYTPAFGTSTLTNGWGVEVTVLGMPSPLTPDYAGEGVIQFVEVGDGLGIPWGPPPGNGQADDPPEDPGNDPNDVPDDESDDGVEQDESDEEDDDTGAPPGPPPPSAPPGHRPGSGSAQILPGTMVLSGHGEAGNFLLTHARAGRSVRITIEADTPWDEVRFAVGGRPILVSGGRPQAPSPGDPLPNSRAPRTAAGIDRSGRLVLVTVDGRQGGRAGMTLPEFADFLAGLGLQSAINLDGGGSTTLYARLPGHMEGRVVNRPSDGAERAVANSVQIISLAPEGTKVSRVWIEPGGPLLVLPGTQVQLTVRAQDEYFGPVDTSRWRATWSVEPVDRDEPPATVDGNGLLTATAPGQGRARVAVDGQQAQVEVTVLSPGEVGEVILDPGPEAGQWQPGQTVTLGVLVLDRQGRPVQVDPASLVWRAGEGLGTVEGSRLTLRDEEPAGELSVSLRYERDGAPVEERLARWLLSMDEEGRWLVVKAPEFDDVLGHWAAEAIGIMAGRGVVQGYPDGLFRPDQEVTRSELVRIVAGSLRAGGIVGDMDYNGDLRFTDADDIPDWVAEDLYAAVQWGLITGYEDGTFRGDEGVTREQAAAIVVRALALADPDRLEGITLPSRGASEDPADEPEPEDDGEDVPPEGDQEGMPESADFDEEEAQGDHVAGPEAHEREEEADAASVLPLFRDDEDIADWAWEIVYMGVQTGLIQGFEDNTFRPQDVLTRAQAVTLLVRVMNWQR
ncbi:MAG TPA: phosphodiester glycosidase family protein [Sphingobacteriaceae bacterium]|nr:phosphodiester glycosidase family protein [Sphingobacteriaceae bacterium]